MNLKIKYQNLRGIFDLNKKKEELNSLEQVTTKEDFWQNVDNANVINTKIAHLKKEINLYEELSKEINEGLEVVNSGEEDLIALIAENMMNRYIQKFKYAGRNVKLLKKILNTSMNLPYPGELKNLLKTSLAFSNPNDKYDYLKRLFDTLNNNSVIDANNCLKTLQDNGFTVRDIEILTGVSKSQVSRKIKEVK